MRTAKVDEEEERNEKKFLSCCVFFFALSADSRDAKQLKAECLKRMSENEL